MATYERSVRVAAPFEDVWEFHSTVKGLEELTPNWMNLQIEEVRGPDDELDPGVLEPGATISASVRPLGVGPRQSWVSRITDRGRTEGSAYFQDVMEDGPFETWEHTHTFHDDGGETVVQDSIDYAFPMGKVGEVVSPLGWFGFEPMFRFRHRRTKALLE
jgi:ligand-binding SRPBCC domain-containing protein